MSNSPDDSPLPAETIEAPIWSRTTRYMVLVLVLAFFIWLMVAARPLLGPLVISALLAYILNPSVVRLSTHIRIRRSIAVTIIYVLGLLLISGLLSLLIPYLIGQGQILTEELILVGSEIQRRMTAQETLMVWGIRLPLTDLVNWLQSPSASFLGVDRVFDVLQSMSQNLAWVLVILVTTYYLLLDWHRLREWLFGLAPPLAQEDVRRLYARVATIWWAYLRGQIALMFVIGLLNSLVGTVVGLPGAVAIGLMGGLLDIIPSVGPLVAMIAATVIAYVQGSSYLPLSNELFALLVLALYGGIQGLENVWLRPRIMSYNVKIHPAVVFIAIMASLALSSILVTLLIIPLIGTFLVIGGYLRCRIFGLDPWTTELPLELVEGGSIKQEKSASSVS